MSAPCGEFTARPREAPATGGSGQLNAAVIVAMAAVRMMQMSCDEVIHMVAVRHRFVPAIRAVCVVSRVACARVLRGACGWISGTHRHRVFIHVIAVRLVQMAIMQVVHVVAVLDARVAASGSVSVRVSFVNLMFVCHIWLLDLDAAFGRAGVSLACSSALNTSSAMCWSARA
jgi:hypothetical protein